MCKDIKKVNDLKGNTMLIKEVCIPRIIRIRSLGRSELKRGVVGLEISRSQILRLTWMVRWVGPISKDPARRVIEMCHKLVVS